MCRINNETDYIKENTFRIPSTVKKYSYSVIDGKLPQDFLSTDKIEEGWFIYNDPLLGIK